MGGKDHHCLFAEATNEYVSRLKFYLPLEVVTIPDLKQTKALTQAQQRDKEGELILKSLDSSDFVCYWTIKAGNLRRWSLLIG